MATVRNVMHTYFRVYKYEFSWTIDNFSAMPDTLRGPSFTPIPECSKKYCLELRYSKSYRESFLFVSLKDLDLCGKSLFVSSYITICNIEEDILYELEKPSSMSLNLMSESFPPSRGKMSIYQKWNLLEDKLLVKGTLSFSGYDVTSSISSLKTKNIPDTSGDLLKSLKAMYQSGSLSDATFSVGGKTLPAHKNILCNRSPVFAAMFNNDMLESNTNNVVIEDANFHDFNCFLVFLYTGVVEDTQAETVLSLYSLAHKYEVESLRKTCTGLLGSILESSLVCRVLLLSDLHGDKELKELASVFIRDHLNQVVGRNEWIEIVATKSELVKEVLAPLDSETVSN